MPHRDADAHFSAPKLYAALLLPLLAAFGIAAFVNGSISMLLSCGAIGGAILWILSLYFTAASGRPFGAVDAIRVIGWVLIGFSEGVREIAGSYYRHFYPNYSGLAQGCAYAGILTGAFTIVLATIYIPPPPSLQTTGCPRCGYDLAGNTSGTCPECGTPAKPHRRNHDKTKHASCSVWNGDAAMGRLATNH